MPNDCSNNAPRSVTWTCRGKTLSVGGGSRPLIMGILNVTPDSFSDGGRYLDHEQALVRGRAMIQEGADIIDVGGESSRPGSVPISVEDELARILPVVELLCRENTVLISIDTTKSAVAERCLEAGAHVINDISAMEADPRMPDVVRESGAGAILMHKRGTPDTMQDAPHYENVVKDVSAYLRGRLEAATRCGIALEALAIDPGIGFGKTTEHNCRLLGSLNAFTERHRPLVVGVSRKRFLGHLTGRDVGDRTAASLGALAFCLTAGAQIMRVHDVRASRDAANVVHALMQEPSQS